MGSDIYEWPKPYECNNEDAEMDYVFISYSHNNDDKEIVRNDLNTMDENGVRFWYDKAIHVGDDWKKRAEKKINSTHCRGVLFYLSSSSLLSNAVQYEMELVNNRLISSNTNKFGYASVNIGQKSVFEILKTININEKDFLYSLQMFNQDKLFVKRDIKPLATSHFVSIFEPLMDWEVVDENKCSITNISQFEYIPYKNGIQITRYNGEATSLSIPTLISEAKVNSIGIYAFSKNEELTSVIVPEGVEFLDDFCFTGCGKLEQVTLPNSLITLGYEAFRACSKLKSITLPHNVSFVGEYCFYQCHELNEIKLLSTNKLVLGFGSFSECFSLKSLELPEALSEIGSYAFNTCSRLQSITIPQNTITLGRSPFHNCSGLKQIILQPLKPPFVLDLLSRCKMVEEIIIDEKSVYNYEDSDYWKPYGKYLKIKLNTPSNIVFENNILRWRGTRIAQKYEVNVNNVCFYCDKAELVNDFLKQNINFSIKIKAKGNSSEYIDSEYSYERTFINNLSEFEYIVENEQKVLSKYNGNEKRIIIPDGTEVIGEKAFYNMQFIEEVVFPDSVCEVREEAFFRCNSLTRIYFNNGLAKIGNKACQSIGVKELLLPDNIEHIGEFAFSCCSNLIKVVIRSRVIELVPKTFYRCVKMEEVILPPSLKRLNDGTFRGCTELDKVILPEGLEYIGGGVISYIMRMKSIKIPGSVREIAQGAFDFSTNMTEFIVDKTNKRYADDNGVLIDSIEKSILQFPANKNLIEYEIPSYIKKIGKGAFSDSEILEEVFCSNSIDKVGENAFQRSQSLKKVVFEGDVGEIGDNAFDGCGGLSLIVLKGSILPSIGKGILKGTNPDLVICVNFKYLNNYKESKVWEKYLDKVIATEESF